MSNDNVPTMVDEITFLNITLLTVKKIQPIQLCGTLQLKKKGDLSEGNNNVHKDNKEELS